MNTFLPDFHDLTQSLRVIITIIIPAVLLLIVLYSTKKVPPYVFRKLLHMVAYTIISAAILTASGWLQVSLSCVLLAVLIYPLLAAAERFDVYSKIFVEKKPGEIKLSMLEMFLTSAAVCALAWGISSRSYIAAAAVLMWGVGDEAAALIGIPFGVHRITWKLTDGKKSLEGTLAGMTASFAAGLAVFLIFSENSISVSLITCLVTAAASAFSELISKNGNDTIIVPLVNTFSLLILHLLFHL